MRRAPRLLILGGAILAAPYFVVDSSHAQEVHPQQGERIRVEVGPATAAPFQDETLVANGPIYGAMRLPLDGIESLHVERRKSTAYAIAKGGLVGTAFGVGMWRFLDILCRTGCDSGLGSAWFPAAVSGALVALVVGTRAPGRQWISVPLPR
jgi:hypothetical protein